MREYALALVALFLTSITVPLATVSYTHLRAHET